MSQSNAIPQATVARLPIYLRVLTTLASQEITTVSSEMLAASVGINSAKLRKDLSFLGSHGTRGVGYGVQHLKKQIGQVLGLAQSWQVVIVGIGNLGSALANYAGLAARGFYVSALVDQNRDGETIAGMLVQPVNKLPQIVASGVYFAVLATPAAVAQEVSDQMVAAGITSIVNFTPVVLKVPQGINVRDVDLSTELQILAFHASRESTAGAANLASLTNSGAQLDLASSADVASQADSVNVADSDGATNLTSSADLTSLTPPKHAESQTISPLLISGVQP